MRQENIDKLEKYRRHYDSWVNDQVLNNLDGRAKQEIIEVIREEFNPGYVTDLWCGVCIGAMVKYAFEEMDKRKVDIIKIKFD